MVVEIIYSEGSIAGKPKGDTPVVTGEQRLGANYASGTPQESAKASSSTERREIGP